MSSVVLAAALLVTTAALAPDCDTRTGGAFVTLQIPYAPVVTATVAPMAPTSPPAAPTVVPMRRLQVANVTTNPLVDSVYTVKMWVTDDSFIDKAISFANSDEQPTIPVFSDILAGVDCDAQWSWHVDPHTLWWRDSPKLSDSSTCLATPLMIESNAAVWVGVGHQWCPQPVAAVLSVLDKRDDDWWWWMWFFVYLGILALCCCLLCIGLCVYYRKAFGKPSTSKKRGVMAIAPTVETPLREPMREMVNPTPTTSVPMATYQPSHRSVELRVPAGMTPRQEIVGRTPEGGVVRATIPDGFQPGMTLHVTY